MSRQNKVNPGMYTQRGRLTQDDAARELSRQRNIGSPGTWQPVQRDRTPPFTAEHGEGGEGADAAPAAIERVPARAKAAKPAAVKATTATRRGKAKAGTVKPKAKAARRRKS